MSQTPGPASPWCFHSTSGDVCKLAHRLGADAGACPQAMSGDELNTLQYFSLLAAQHGMLWTNVDLLPGCCREGSSTDDLNRLGGWLGVMSQSNGDSDPQINPRESDLLTAEHLGARVADVARALRSGRALLDQSDSRHVVSSGAHTATEGGVAT